MMRWHISRNKLILCGSISNSMATYPSGIGMHMETCWEHVDYLSMHRYSRQSDNDTPATGPDRGSESQIIPSPAAALGQGKAALEDVNVYLSWMSGMSDKARNMDGQWT